MSVLLKSNVAELPCDAPWQRARHDSPNAGAHLELADRSPAARPVLPLLWPLLSLLAATLIIRTFDLDRALCRLCSDPVSRRFPLADNDPWISLYHYGPWPGLLLGAGAGACIAAIGLWRRQWHVHVRIGMFLLMAAMLGPGFLVNGVLKTYWGRPRPHQTVDFGGHLPFSPIGDIGVGLSDHNGSFPSGHASIAFFLLAPAFLCRDRKHWRRACLAMGLAWGTLSGIGRVVQGAHFPSDILWSGGITYLAAWCTAWLLRVDRVDIADLFRTEDRLDAGS